ncbi:ribonuclease HII [Desulfolucanica intricata]|uniref:ribonuclease HII n=1 Tax=Desulfolucanica intricata TaxID=1285191 RepID=UPI000831AED6|nr:ribonuclease HII [Desulfolucanica intricata]
MSISELKLHDLKKLVSEFYNNNEIPDNAFLQEMAKDNRIGVRKLYEQLLARKQEYENEKMRLSRLYAYERKCKLTGYQLIAGVDEAGRGPLAGPVVAAAVILPEQAYLPGLKDSKKLSAIKRESLFVKIKGIAISWSVQIASVKEILQFNIYKASLLAMRRAVCTLKIQPDFVLVDGVKIAGLNKPQLPLVKGDTLSASIAAASILAKVTRDHLMMEYHKMYPQYGFDQNKGYPTAEHKKALTEYGPCLIHRADFKPVKESYVIMKNNK